MECFQYWLYSGEIAQQRTIEEIGYTPERNPLEGDHGNDNGENGNDDEPLRLHVAIDLFFLAWDLGIPKLMDDAITVLFEHYVGWFCTPSSRTVRRIFDNRFPVGHYIHFLCVDMFIRFSFPPGSTFSTPTTESLASALRAYRTSTPEVRNPDGDKEGASEWPESFLSFFVRRYKVLEAAGSATYVHGYGLVQHAPGDLGAESAAQRGARRMALCDYHQHAIGACGVYAMIF
jgi:hypothetical protein